MKGTFYVGAAQPAEGPNTRGLYRRKPSQGSWEKLQNGLPSDLQVNCIVARPDDPRSLYLGAQCGLFHSADGGDSWTDCGLKVGEKDIYSILLHPTDTKTIYVGLDYAAIAKTTDGGKTWRYLPTVQPKGAIDACFPVRVLRMALNPADPDELYAAMEVGGVTRSLDGGETWEDMSAPLIEMVKEPHLKSKILSDNETEGMMDLHAMVVTAGKPSTVWVANRMGLFTSDDKGRHWHEFGIKRFSDLSYGRDIMISPHDPKVLLAALSDSSRGVKGSLCRSEDGGKTWKRIDHGHSVDSTAMTLSASSQDPNRFCFAARLGQVFGTEDGGGSWEALPLPDGVVDVRAIACT